MLSRKFIKLFSLTIVAALSGTIAGILIGYKIKMPLVSMIENIEPNLETTLISRNGIPFKKYALEKRIIIFPGQLPHILAKAIIAIEDENFLKHGGIDLKGVLRAAIVNLKYGTIKQGASTITMQLARNLFLTHERTWSRKLSEVLLSIEIEKRYSKEQILTMYANTVYMGEGIYGMAAAAKYYFNKKLSEIELPEAALLAGIPQKPVGYNPFKYPKRALARRNQVLKRMYEVGFISKDKYREALNSPLNLNKGTELKRGVGEFFAEEVRKILAKRFGSHTIYKAGFTVKTTIDLQIQKDAKQALRNQLLKLEHLKGFRGPIGKLNNINQKIPEWEYIETLEEDELYRAVVTKVKKDSIRVKVKDFSFTLGRDQTKWVKTVDFRKILSPKDIILIKVKKDDNGTLKAFLEQEPLIEGAIIVIENRSGAVRALVGGWSWDKTKFNRATQARRQIGSAFKPFLYGAAIESGFTPSDTIFDGPVAFKGASGKIEYSPRNYYRKYYGIVTLRRALENSINVTAVKLMQIIGYKKVEEFARKCGLNAEIPHYPSAALGTVEVTPLNLASSYVTIANLGLQIKPFFIEEVKNRYGKTIFSHTPQISSKIDPKVAYVLLNMMRGVTVRGTGSSLRELELDIAGKTGTTSRFTDAWFAGFTPQYTIVVWVGYDKEKFLGKGMTGAKAALPAWKELILKGLKSGWISKEAVFNKPSGISTVKVEYYTGLLAIEEAKTVINEEFIKGSEPLIKYDKKWEEILKLPWFLQRPFYTPKKGEPMPEDVDDWQPIIERWEKIDKMK